MMWALIKKDLRLNLAPISGALIFSLLPYLLSLGNLWVNPPEGRPTEAYDYAGGMMGAGYASLFLMILMSSAFGGMAFAAERRERTAEFLAMMPVSRGKIIISKLLVAIGCLAIVLAVHAGVLVICEFWMMAIGQTNQFDHVVFHHALTSAAFAFVLFGIAWALSVFIQSAAISASISIGVGFAFAFGGTFWVAKVMRLLSDDRHVIEESTAMEITACIAVFLTLLAVISTSIRYARRVEP